MQNKILIIANDNKNNSIFQKLGIEVINAFHPQLFKKLEQAAVIYIQEHLRLPNEWFGFGHKLRLHGGYYLLQRAIEKSFRIKGKLGFFNSGGNLKSSDSKIQILQSESVPYKIPAAPNTWIEHFRCHNHMRDFENIRDSFIRQTTPPSPSFFQKITQRWL